MPLRVSLAEPSLGGKEESGLPPLVAGRDLLSQSGGERKEPLLPEQPEGAVGEQELLGGELVPIHLGLQMDSLHQEPPAIWGQLTRGNAQVYQYIPGKRMQRKAEGSQ